MPLGELQELSEGKEHRPWSVRAREVLPPSVKEDENRSLSVKTFLPDDAHVQKAADESHGQDCSHRREQIQLALYRSLKAGCSRVGWRSDHHILDHQKQLDRTISSSIDSTESI